MFSDGTKQLVMKVMKVMKVGDMTPKVGVQANFEAVDLSDQAQAE